MQVTKSQKRLLIVLGIVVAYGIFDISTNLETYKKVYSGSSKARTVKQKTAVDAAKTTTTNSNMQASYLAGWGRDPFYLKEKRGPAVNKKIRRKKTVNLRLLAISTKGNNSIALINDKIVKLGDIISGYRVLKISQTKVYLSDGKRKITLKLQTF